MTSRRVLVTGASGFIGRHSLNSLLERDFEVHAVYAHDPIESDARVIWHKADLLDEASRELCDKVRATHLLHFAWIATPGIYWTSPENLEWKESTLALLEAFKESGGSRAVLAGTCAEYDWSVPQDFFSETTSPLKPTTLYGTCKHETHLAAEQFAQSQSMSLAWGRIFFLYGPHEPQTRLVPYVITSLLAGRVAECSSGEQIRDFLHVGDVADAFVALLDSEVIGAVNIASGAPVAVEEVIYVIADMLGNRELVHLGAKPTPENDPPRLVADVMRLKDEIVWSPRYGLKDGLRLTTDWWKARGA